MGFMKPEIYKGQAYVIETSHGTEIVPVNIAGGSADRVELSAYCEGKIESWEVVSGYLARLSAPGYLDCTEWTLHETLEQAKDDMDLLLDDETEEG